MNELTSSKDLVLIQTHLIFGVYCSKNVEKTFQIILRFVSSKQKYKCM